MTSGWSGACPRDIQCLAAMVPTVHAADRGFIPPVGSQSELDLSTKPRLSLEADGFVIDSDSACDMACSVLRVRAALGVATPKAITPRWRLRAS
jgi:hypothetical protein